jgi:hypothetical protein
VPRRVAVTLVQPLAWSPPGIDPGAWQHALAEDTLDVLALMNEVDAGLAVAVADEPLLADLGWPGINRYVLPDLLISTVFTAIAAEGYEQVALVAADAPDLPGLLIAKLLRPLTSHPLAAAGALGGNALLGIAANLPAPVWLPAVGLDDATPQTLRRSAPQASDVAAANGWHRLRGPGDLARLDLRLGGWEATRALLTADSPR